MAAPIPCLRCGEALYAPVRFCPFCGLRQEVAVPEPVRPAAPAPAPGVPSADMPVPPRPIEPPPDRHRLRTGPPPPAPEPAPQPAAPPAPSAPIWVDRRQARAAPTRQTRRNPNRGVALRRLAAAGFVLVCAAVLWRQLVTVPQPHGTVLVHLERPVGGSILVDGIADGAPDQPISLPPGRHRISSDAAGFDTPSRSVVLRDGETARLTLFPSPRPATLVLDSTPTGAAISLDGRAIGRTPLQRSLPPGRHRIVATAPDLLPLAREIELDPGAATPLSLSLAPVPLRRIALDAPPGGRWSEPTLPGAGARFTLLFQDPIRVRIGGRVVLLEPGAPVELGAADATGLSVSAVGDHSVPVRVLIAPAGAQGSD